MGRPIHVLLVEDSEDDAVLVLRELRKNGYAPSSERVETAEAMREALASKSWDIVLSDCSMPHFGAVPALELLKGTGLDVPFVIVSGTIGEEAAVSAMRAGAHDFVLKGKLARLAPTIERELRESEGRKARRRAESDLRESEARYRALFESSPQPMWVFDAQTLVFLAVNEAAVRHYGYSRGEFATMTVADIEVPAPRLPENATRQHRTKDGTILRVELKSHGFEFNGRHARLVLVNDVTERLRAEEALRKTEEQLRQAQKMDAVGRLAGGVAHDFNNMLSVILGYGELIMADLKPGDPVRDDLREMSNAAKRAADLTRQLLMFSRQQVIEPKVLDLNAVLGGMDKMLRRLLGADVDLVSVLNASVGRVKADPGHMEQVIMNLAVNARDAMPSGGKLTMETGNVVLDEAYARDHAGATAGPHVMLAVSDTGTGMDAATQARIFEPFFTTKDAGKGTGLGLSTVFGIVKQSGGNLWVYSEPGKGATFKVYLPRIDADLDRAGRKERPRNVHGSETILLVENDDQVRAVARNILKKHGYEVIEARNGAEALRWFEVHAGKIDLLLTDVVMPGVSGPELAARARSARPGTRVLCMSGYTDDTVVRHGVLDADAAYLQKPITVESLTMKVRQVLDD